MGPVTEWLSGVKEYIYAGVAAIIIALGITVYIQHVKLGAKDDKIAALTTQNQTSNQSVTDLTNTLKQVNSALAAKEKADQKKQAEIHAQLELIQKQDQSLRDLTASLNNRKSTSNCPVPKDLTDAWNSL